MGLFGLGKKNKDAKKDAPPLPPSPSDDAPPLPPTPSEQNTTDKQPNPLTSAPADTEPKTDDLHLPDLPDAPSMPQMPGFPEQSGNDKQNSDDAGTEEPSFPGFELPPLDDEQERSDNINRKDTKDFFEHHAKPKMPDLSTTPKQSDEDDFDDEDDDDEGDEASVEKIPGNMQDEPMRGSSLVEGIAVRYDKKSGQYFFSIDDFKVIREHMVGIDIAMRNGDKLIQIEKEITAKEAELFNKLKNNVTTVQNNLSQIHDTLFEG